MVIPNMGIVKPLCFGIGSILVSFMVAVMCGLLELRFKSQYAYLNQLYNSDRKSEIVARTNSKTGKLLGYGIISKTKRTPPP